MTTFEEFGNIFMKNACFFINSIDAWIVRDFHGNPRVLGVNGKTWFFDHFPKGYISKNGRSVLGNPKSCVLLVKRENTSTYNYV